MPVNYNPQDASGAWPEGEYQAVLCKVEDTTSKASGNPMQVWTWTVYNPDGRQQEIKDYVVVPQATFKIKQLAAALGKRAEFDAGQFQADNNVDASVVAEVVIEKQDGFDDQNKIKKYKAKTGAAAASATAPTSYPKFHPMNKGGGGKPGRGPDGPTSDPRSPEQVFQEQDIPFRCDPALWHLRTL